jgi:hypothetical protein
VMDVAWLWVLQGVVVVGVGLWCRAAALRAVRGELGRWQDEMAALLEAACDRLESAPARREAKSTPVFGSRGRTTDPAAARLKRALAQHQATRR